VLQRSGLELCRLIGSVDWSHAVWGQIEKIETETHGFNQHHSFGSAPVLPLSSAPTPGSHGHRPSNLGFRIPAPVPRATAVAALPLAVGHRHQRHHSAPTPPGAGAGVLSIGSPPLWLYCRRDFLVNTTYHLGSRNFHSLTASAMAWCLPWSCLTMTPTELQVRGTGSHRSMT